MLGGGGLKRPRPTLSCSAIGEEVSVYTPYPKSMEHSPSLEANRSSATQGIPRILCNQKVPYSQQPATCAYPEPD
jgi:hypothetical protein